MKRVVGMPAGAPEMLVCIDCKTEVIRGSVNQIRCKLCGKRENNHQSNLAKSAARAAFRAENPGLLRALPNPAIEEAQCYKCHQVRLCKLVKLNSNTPKPVCEECRRRRARAKYEKAVSSRAVAIVRKVAASPSRLPVTPITCQHRTKLGACIHRTSPWGDCLTQRARGLCALGFTA